MGAGVSGTPPPASSPPPPKGSGVAVNAVWPGDWVTLAPGVGDVSALVASIVTPSRMTVGMGVAVALSGMVWPPAAVAVAAADSLVAAAAGAGGGWGPGRLLYNSGSGRAGDRGGLGWAPVS